MESKPESIFKFWWSRSRSLFLNFGGVGAGVNNFQTPRVGAGVGVYFLQATSQSIPSGQYIATTTLHSNSINTLCCCYVNNASVVMRLKSSVLISFTYQHLEYIYIYYLLLNNDNVVIIKMK